MATLKEIQNCQLGILKDVADFCDKYDINYYLAYGTFLGAVRHKGFIPWDDDVDIFMEYYDLQRFKKLFIKEMSDKYFYQDAFTDPGYSWLFPKVRKNNTYMPEAENATIHQGVWIDIFPLISLSDNMENSKKMIDLIFDYQTELSNYTWSRAGNAKGIKKMTLFMYKTLSKHRSVSIKKKIKKYQSTTSNEYIPLSNSFSFGMKAENSQKILNKTLEKRWFDQIDYYEFENCRLKSVKNYDAYLKKNYGNDYLTPIRFSHLSDYSKVIV